MLVTNLNATTATFNGNVVTDNGSTIIERGVVMDPAKIQPLCNKITTSGTTGSLSECNWSNSSHTYYYRAYAINAHGTSYGDNIQVRTLPGDPMS
jgi:hypothetical protein